MSYDYLRDFLNPDGSTSKTGQEQAGRYEEQRGWTPAPQQPFESDSAYWDRARNNRNSNS